MELFSSFVVCPVARTGGFLGFLSFLELVSLFVTCEIIRDLKF